MRAYAFDHLLAARVIHHLGDDGRAPGWQFVDGGDVQIGVVAHGQGPGYRGGGHHEQVGLQRRCGLRSVRRQLAAQGQALRHAKTVLLVNDGQRQVLEQHFVLNDGVRANHQPGLAAFNQRQHLTALFRFLTAGEPRGGDAQWLQPADQLGEVLGGQNLGRRHQGTLPASVDADRRGERRDHGFAGAHIALQQAVHGHGLGQVMRNFCADASLRGGQLKRQCRQQLFMQVQRQRPIDLSRQRFARSLSQGFIA